MRLELEPPVVAIVGSARCSAYGAETARALGRGLAAAGVTVASTSERGIAAAALEGVRELGGRTIVVESSGLDRTAHDRTVTEPPTPADTPRATCTITELAPQCAGRAFGPIAAERLGVALASLVVVVEARASARELNAARVALDWPRPLAAVPGRAGSPTADGSHALLRRGAALVCGAADALALLPARSHNDAPRDDRWGDVRSRDNAARELLARVAEGEDTLDRLLERGGDAGATLLALSELEVAGLLTRDRDGAYVPAQREREAAASAADALLAGLKPPPDTADDD
jgi:DNA processing protein